MTDPLSLLRQYNIDKKEIVEKNGKIIFGKFSWPKTILTNFLMWGTGRDGRRKEYYTLECVLFFLKNRMLSHPVYIRQASARNIPIVHRPDRRDLWAYLIGEKTTCMSIDNSASLEAPIQIKRSRGDNSLQEMTKKRRIEDTLKAPTDEQRRAVRLDTSADTVADNNIKPFSKIKSANSPTFKT